jgi:DNA adenine methylase
MGDGKMAKRVVDDIVKALTIPHGRISLPFKRFGSKGQWASKLASLLPSHQIYVEVFGGTGAVLLAKPPSTVEVFNDIDNEIVNFFQVLRTKPAELIARCFLQPYARADFQRYINEPMPNDPVERAARYMFLTNAAFRYQDFREGTFSCHISSGNAKKDNSNARCWVAKVNRLIWYAMRFRDVIIENRDFEDIFRIYDRPETVFFCDPPYTQGEFAWSPSEHERLAKCLRQLKGKFLLTIDDSPLARRCYGNFHLITVLDGVVSSSTRGGRKAKRMRHLVLANYEPKVNKDGEDEGVD